ncbi:MAG: hypothetical protein R6V27_10475 [Balneolaceae bacterium]
MNHKFRLELQRKKLVWRDINSLFEKLIGIKKLGVYKYYYNHCDGTVHQTDLQGFSETLEALFSIPNSDPQWFPGFRDGSLYLHSLSKFISINKEQIFHISKTILQKTLPDCLPFSDPGIKKSNGTIE